MPTTDARVGLTTTQVITLRKQHGQNRFIETREAPVWLQYVIHFRNPLVLILLLASALSALLGEFANFAIIAVIVIASVTLDFLQEHRAQRAAERLRQSIALQTCVIRDGKEQTVPMTDIVPGDIVLLKAGDLVPADGMLIESRDCFVNQALLTGESSPVEKTPAVPSEGSDLVAATNALFMGTSVLSGSASVVIVRTGPSTEMGKISQSISGPDTVTSFDLGARRFNTLIMQMTVLMVLFVLMVNVLSHKPWLESFLFAIALAVGLTPELLPMVVSVTLARGAVRMAKEKMIVKRQTAIQDLGSMDILCTDKTGTLTEASIRIESCVDPLGAGSESVLQFAWLNSCFESGLRNPMDHAILAEKAINLPGWKKIDEVPFDFERRRVSVLLEQEDKRWLIVKGAPDETLRICTQYEAGGQRRELDKPALERVKSTCDLFEEQGLRVLAIAYREVAPTCQRAVVDDESAMVLCGFLTFIDPPKQDAGRTLRSLARLGISVKVLTGDSERVTRHIYHALQLNVDGVLLGADIDKLDDAALQVAVQRANLFCRMNPSQKGRVIAALRARGHVVGYLGDGVNDAPSLHAADVGISVDSAVDVAKAAADMIMLKHDLEVLHDAVLEGRRTFGNIMKYIMMGSSSNFGNMFSMAGSALVLPFLPMSPVQILLNNLLYDVSETTIPFDSVDSSSLQQPHVLDIALVRNFMWSVGPVSSVFDFLTFWLLLKLFNANEAMFQTAWFIESLCTQVLVIFVIRTRGNPLKSLPHPLLTSTSAAIVLLGLALPFTPAGSWFGFVPPPAGFFLILPALVGTYLLAVEGVKQKFYRRQQK